MRKYLYLVAVLGLLSACSTSTEHLVEPYNTGFISSTGTRGYSPFWTENYVNGLNAGWYAGTPDYFSHSVYSNDW